MKDHLLTLPNSQTLSFLELGDPHGKPFFYFHGFPASRKEALLAGPVAEKLGVRILAPDRPGIGRSTFRPGRKLSHWPDDVARIADSLGIDKFAVCGVSGGGPYAAACAALIPERLTRAGIVCGVGPPDTPRATDTLIAPYRYCLMGAQHAPWLARAFLFLTAPLFRIQSRALLVAMARGLPGPDKALLENGSLGNNLFASVSEGFLQGWQGPAHDLLLYGRPWGFSLSGIGMEVLLWQGGLDRCVSPAMAHALEKAIPRCRSKWYPDEGHFSLVVNHMEEIIGQISATKL